MTNLLRSNPTKPTTAEVSKMLRFVERGGKRILQQGWDIKTYDADTCACIGLHLEWRDVPLEKE